MTHATSVADEDDILPQSCAIQPEILEFLRLDKSHAAEVVALETLCFSHPWTEKQFSLAFEQQVFHVFGLKHTDRLLSYVAFYHAGPEMEILNLAVHPEYRRQGLGARLLGLVLRICAKMGIAEACLEVRRSNVAALKLYARHGFHEVGARKAYYPDNGEDALIMRRVFSRWSETEGEGE